MNLPSDVSAKTGLPTFIVGIAFVLLSGCDNGRGETDEYTTLRLTGGYRSGNVWLVTEKATGCQFVSDIHGLKAITPGCEER